MKKQFVISAAILILLLALMGCSGKNTIKGHYELTQFMVNGWNMASEAKGTYFDSKGADNNSISTFHFEFKGTSGSLSDTVTGYLSTESESGDFITYKFWVVSHVGNFFSDSTQWFYVDYDAKNDIVSIQTNKDAEFRLEK